MKKLFNNFIIKVTDIIFLPVALIVNSIVFALPPDKQNKANSFIKRLTTPGIRFMSLILLIIMVSSIFMSVYTQINPPKPSINTKANLPSMEKVAEGVWKLNNYDPIKQVIAEGPKPEDMKIVPNNNGSYKWIVTNENGTRFMFGKQENDGLKPFVRIVNREGYFVQYSPKDFHGSVTPKVENNIISWGISPGITARYTMQKDRVKEDIIVNSKDQIEGNKVNFTVISGNEKDNTQIMSGDLMPGGDIDWYSGKEEVMNTQFTFPAPVVKDNIKKEIASKYQLEKLTAGQYLLSISLDPTQLKTATLPVTVDPVVIDSAAGAQATDHSGRRLLRDAWGNLIAVFDGGASEDDNVWYKNYNSASWTDANIDLDNVPFAEASPIAADLDSTGSAHLVWEDTLSLDIEYMPLKITRSGNNTITSMGTQAIFALDSSDRTFYQNLIIVNKGGGPGEEKIVVIYAIDTSSGLRRNEMRAMQCDVNDACNVAANWKNASEEINGSSTCSDAVTSGAAGLPNASNCKGTSDALFSYTTAHTFFHGNITQMPGKPKRSPSSVQRDANGVFSVLSNTIDSNTGTADSINSLTTTDYIYVGDDKPFSKVTFDITNTNSNAQLMSTMEYWNGSSWVTLSNKVDNTATATISFSEDGSMLFDEPSNWSTTSVNSVSKYWVRFRPAGAFDASVSIAEVYITDRNSKALIANAANYDTGDLRAAYIPWDEVNNDRWENRPNNAGNGWREDAGGVNSVLDDNVASVFTLPYAVDYKNNIVYFGYNSASNLLQIKGIQINKDITVAANWISTAVPDPGSTTNMGVALTSDGENLYYIEAPSGGSVGDLVVSACNPGRAGRGDICDNASDWGSVIKILSNTLFDWPGTIATKVTDDITAIDIIYTGNNSNVSYERHYVDLADKTVTVAASGDDAWQRDCDSGTDDQNIASESAKLGREATDVNCSGSVNSENHAGFRFSNVTVPQGSLISSAFLDFRVSTRSGSTAIDFSVYGEDGDNSSAFTAFTDCADPCSNGVNTRTKTTSASSSSINFTTVTYRIDVTKQVQEIICRGASNVQPCVGDFNGSGSWASGNALSLLLISAEGGGSDNFIHTVSMDDIRTQMLDPTLQINVAPTTVTNKKYSLGSGTALPTGNGSVSDLGHPFSSLEYQSVSADDTNFASVSATTNFASASAVPAFMFKVNNTNNNNTYKIDASAILKSSLATTNKSIYLQVYRGGSTDDWVTMDTDSATAADTDITLSSTVDTNLSEYYFNETPGVGSQYAECTDGTTNCWTYWRIYQDAPGSFQNANLNLDYFNAAFSANGGGASGVININGGVNIRGGTSIINN